MPPKLTFKAVKSELASLDIRIMYHANKGYKLLRIDTPGQSHTAKNLNDALKTGKEMGWGIIRD